jgi:septal ring factor EnvC (AmiA/AmiB activator)
MARSTLPPLQRQLARARRRLFLQGLLDGLTLAWAAALALAAGWFLLQPHLLPDALPWLRWAVLGGLVAASTLAAVTFSVIRRPRPVGAALALDERFGLRERVTTGLLLGAAERSSPAGVALLEDVNRRVEPLAVGDRFPVRLRWAAALVPLLAVALGLVALFYKPAVARPPAPGDEPLAQSPEVKAQIEEKMRQLQKKPAEKKAEDRDRAAELQRLEADLEKLSRAPRDTKEQAREVVKDMTALEDQIKKREKELAQRAESLKEQMKQVERLTRKENKEGPAKGVEKALEKGDFEKAREELRGLSDRMRAEQEAEKLEKKLKGENLSQEERDQAQKRLDELKGRRMSQQDKERLRDQVKSIEEKLRRLSQKKEERQDWLRDLARKGEFDPEQLKKELEQLEKDSADMDPADMEKLRQMAEKAGRCQKCMREGKDAEAQRLLDELGDEMGRLDREAERDEMGQKRDDLEEAKRSMCEALDGGKPVPAAGRRPESKQGVTGSEERRERSRMGPGKLRVVDQVPGEGFKGPRKPDEMTEEIRQAAQEAPEAIDRQRLPRSASDMAKGYFEKLRGDREAKKADKR